MLCHRDLKQKKWLGYIYIERERTVPQMVRHHQRIFAQIKLFLIFQTSWKWSVMIYIIIQCYKLDENVVWSSAIEDFSTLLSLKFAEFTYSKSPCKICERKYRSFCGIFLPTWQCDYSKLVSIIGLGITILYTAVSLIKRLPLWQK